MIKRKKTGFTLLEMIVALSVFTVTALVSVSSLLSLTDAQRKAFALQSAYDNLRFALETMSKDIRTGGSYYCGVDANDIPPVFSSKDCPSGGQSFTYEDALGRRISYRRIGGQIEKLIDGTPQGPLTAEDINIENLFFYVLGSLPSSQESPPQQPRVTVTLKGTAGSGRSVATFNLQTTVTQRRVEL